MMVGCRTTRVLCCVKHVPIREAEADVEDVGMRDKSAQLLVRLDLVPRVRTVAKQLHRGNLLRSREPSSRQPDLTLAAAAEEALEAPAVEEGVHEMGRRLVRHHGLALCHCR